MAENLTAATLFFGLSWGIIPALFWLWFWLREDPHPEPWRILFLTFLSGMAAVSVVLFLEYVTSLLFNNNLRATGLILIWAFIEEFSKYGAAYSVALTRRSFDEPIDAPIYLITVALGFAAAENILFSLNSFASFGLIHGFIAGNLRFVGATLLHVACSGIIGSSIAFAFYKRERMKYALPIGLGLATILHFVFNYFIINGGGNNLLKIFIPLWLGIIIIIFVLEKIKRIKRLNIKQ